MLRPQLGEKASALSPFAGKNHWHLPIERYSSPHIPQLIRASADPPNPDQTGFLFIA